jgi:hypothetical protein
VPDENGGRFAENHKGIAMIFVAQQVMIQGAMQGALQGQQA